jgi:hypothetical protein
MAPRRCRLTFFAAPLCVIALAAAGCASSTSPSAVDLTGTWTGTIGSGSGAGRALRVTWTISQTDATVSGPATLSTSPAVTAVAFPGLLAGTLHGPDVSLAYTSSLGNVPGFPNCSLSGRGVATVSGHSMTGTFDVTYTSCEGLNLLPPTGDQLLLTKQ